MNSGHTIGYDVLVSPLRDNLGHCNFLLWGFQLYIGNHFEHFTSILASISYNTEHVLSPVFHKTKQKACTRRKEPCLLYDIIHGGIYITKRVTNLKSCRRYFGKYTTRRRQLLFCDDWVKVTLDFWSWIPCTEENPVPAGVHFKPSQKRNPTLNI